MHRFTTNTTRSTDRKSKTKLFYLLFPMVLIVFYMLVVSVDHSTVERQKDSLQDAIERDVLHCYAVEGFYPPSLEYLETHYGLRYDHSIFFVDYVPIGSNIRPDVTIIVKE